jgi:hypothetical protein
MPEVDLSKHITIGFRLSRNTEEPANLIFRVHTPRDASFSEIFHSFIYDYNEDPTHHSEPVEYLIPETEETYGWLFYLKRNWWQRKRILDPELTIEDNGIKGRDVIKANRIFDEVETNDTQEEDF